MKKISPDGTIQKNKRIHDAIIHLYNQRHGEIFNSVEQKRLSDMLARALGYIVTREKGISALDVGSGSGNLTKHLLDLGCNVTAADVSPKALEFVRSQFPNVRTSVLNGEDLSQWPDHAFDLVAAYSVLHHVPDYLDLVREMVRVLKPGGTLVLDHEHAEEYWKHTKEYREFLKEVKKFLPYDWAKWLDPRRYYSRIRKIVDPRYQSEGDIHVFPDDHIEWKKVREALEVSGCKILEQEAYLVYKTGYPKNLYEKYAKTCADMMFIIAQKM